MLRRLALVVAALAFAPALHAANKFVIVGGTQLVYRPQTLTITAGDTVTFVNFGGYHNVVADDGSFRCARGCDGQGGNGNSDNGVWSVTLPFADAGTFGYFCELHGSPGEGMYGTVVVEAAVPISVPVAPIGVWPFALLLGGALLAVAAMRGRGNARNGSR
jgi:plastocyanin